MTANAVVSEPDDSDDVQQAKAEHVVRIIRESFSKVEKQADELAQHFYAVLFTIAPDTRQLFPANMVTQRSRLLRALVHVVQMIDRPHELTPFLRQLGRDHRKFDVLDQHFEAVGTALLAALRKFSGDAWTEEVERSWADGYAIMARNMQEATAEETGPAWWPATVVDHIPLNWDTAVIRVQTAEPIAYQAGQYLSVESPQRRRMWRYLSPANAPRDDHTIDFHIRAVKGGWVSRSLVNHAVIGDVWRIGPPLGNLWANKAANRDLLLVGGGTGVAPLRAVIDELARRGKQPKVQLFFGGRTADDLYNLAELRAFAVQNPWLTVFPVTEDGSASDGARGTLAEVVTSHGAWRNHDVLVSGSPEMIRATVSRMLVKGTTFDQISYDSFTTD